MCERDDSGEAISNNSNNVLVGSFQVLFRKKVVFLGIFALTALPLSVGVLSLSLSVRPVASRIRQLERLALVSPTRFESRQIWQESRALALSLLRLKSLLLPPSLLLSLSAALSSISSAASCRRGRAVNPLVTSLCGHALALPFTLLPFALRVLCSGAEIYLMAVLGLALVVSVLEDRAGWGAIRVAWGIMEGRRMVGWALSGMLLGLSAGIGRAVLGPGEDADLGGGVGGRVEMVWLNAAQFGWACLYGLLVVWGYVLTTVFYCQCRRRHPPKWDVDIQEIQIV